MVLVFFIHGMFLSVCNRHTRSRRRENRKLLRLLFSKELRCFYQAIQNAEQHKKTEPLFAALLFVLHNGSDRELTVDFV